MKKRMNQFIAIALMISLTITFGCEKEKKDTAPQLPPVSTFITDISSLLDNPAAEKSTEVEVLTNAEYAFAMVGGMYIVLKAGLSIPVAAFVTAVNQTPVRIDNDTWQWSFDFDVVDEELTYTALLTADVVGDEVNWEMKISGGEYTDFVWFTGTCDILRTNGTWTLYHNPEAPESVLLTIDWHHNWELETFDATYTFVLAGHNYEGSYVSYGITLDPDYNAFFIFDDTSQEITYNIYYNTETHVGTIEEQVGDVVTRKCWDEYFADTDCTDE